MKQITLAALIWVMGAAQVQSDTMASLRAQMFEQAQEESYEEAVASASQLVEAARQTGDPHELGVALTELGAMRFLNAQHEQATWVLREALHLLKSQGIYDKDLVEVYAFLGLALQATGRHGEAVDAFARGEHVTHRRGGVGNTAQLPLMHAKTRSLLAMGDNWLAEQVQSAAHAVAVAEHGPDSLEAIAATERFGNFLISIGRFKRAITLYRGALDDVPEMTIESIPLLRGLANTYIAQRREAGRSLALTRDIALILDRHKDSFPASDRALAWQDFADLLMSFSHEREAVQAYLTAWDIAMTDPNLAAKWRERYLEPQLVAPGPLVVLDPDESAENAYDYTLYVDDDGRPRWVTLEDTDASARTVRLTNAMVRSIRFRPVIIDGEPQAWEAFALRVQRRPRARPVAQVSLFGAIGGPPQTGPSTTAVQ